jgi:hypothetical protein
MAQTTRGKRETFTVQPLASDAPGAPTPVESSRHEEAEGEPAFGASTNSTGGGERSDETSGSEAPTSRSSLMSAINAQYRSIQAEGGEAHLRTWCADQGVEATSGALADRFGEAARDLRALMGTGVAS